MKRLFLLAAATSTLLCVSSGAAALTPAHRWSRGFGGTGIDEGYCLAVDGSGNVHVAGKFEGTVNLGGGNLTSVGGSDIFVAKYTSAGEHLWSQRFGGTSSESVSSVAVNGPGLVLITGSFQGTANFGGSNLTSAGSTDIYLAAYNSLGAHLWSQRFGGASSDGGVAVTLGGSDNVIVTGYFAGTVNFGGGNRTSAGGYDVFLAKYDSFGAHQLSQRFGGPSDDSGAAVAVDAAGNVVVTGFFAGTVGFGGGNLASAGYADIFVAKYNPAGVHQWSRGFGGTAADYPSSVVVDSPGNVIVTGRFANTVDFGGGDLSSSGLYDVFVAKYNSSGAHQWSRRSGGTLHDYALSVALGSAGSVLVTGHFEGTANFGGGDLTSVGSTDVFVAKYDASGAPKWSQRFGSEFDDYGWSVAADVSGNALVTGSFAWTADFGGSSLACAGGTDIFLAKYASGPAEPVVTSITDIGNDQGRQVSIRFSRSGHDDPDSPQSVTSYRAFRRDDAPPAGSATGSGLGGLSELELLAAGWTEVGSVGAFGEDSYGIVVPTIGDSTIALGPYHSVFYMRAATASPYEFFDSPPDSGYSLDNLAPHAPGDFAVAYYASGGNSLSWQPSPDPDFQYFNVYRSVSANFVPDPGNLVRQSVTNAWIDGVGVGSGYHYLVTAVDHSGNESAAAAPSRISGVELPGPLLVLMLHQNTPNPFNPHTTIKYDLPEAGPVRLLVFDVAGRLVRTLVDESTTQGSFEAVWDGRDALGREVGSGIYLAQLEFGGKVETVRMGLVK